MIKGAKAKNEQSPLIGIAGAGAWGTALACCFRASGKRVRLYGRNQKILQTMASKQQNPAYLGAITLPAGIEFTDKLADLAKSDLLLLAIPAQKLRDFLPLLASFLQKEIPLINTAKGLDAASGQRLLQIIAKFFPHHPLAVLSGPTFAVELATGLPSAATIAAQNNRLAEQLAKKLASRYFRLYHSDDPIGVEIGGAVKNVLAIACGISAGCGYAHNTRAMLVTRGLAEITRFALAFGAQLKTMSGLSGWGDLMLTCSSEKSRNYRFGLAIGRGANQAQAEAATGTVEGLHTIPSIISQSRKLGVEMPITVAVSDIVIHEAKLKARIDSLLNRPFTTELG